MERSMITFTPDEDRALDAAAELLRHRHSVLFVTGAGLSADSGLPTYRGVAGLYEDNDAEDGMPIEEVMSGETRPVEVLDFLLMLRRRRERGESAEVSALAGGSVFLS